MARERPGRRGEKASGAQAASTCECLHGTVRDTFYGNSVREVGYWGVGGLREDLGAWLRVYEEERQGKRRGCDGTKSLPTFLGSLQLAKEKLLVA